MIDLMRFDARSSRIAGSLVRRVVVLVVIALALYPGPGLSAPVPESRVDSAKHFVDLLVRKHFLAAYGFFDRTMKGAVSEPKLREIWNDLNAEAGPFVGRVATRTEKAGVYDVVFVTCRFEKAMVDVKVVYDAPGQIAGLFFLPAEDPRAAGWAPPDHVKAELLDEREVTVGSGEWALPATLSSPKAPGRRLPAVLLVHGSGPHDRDETIGPNKPFKDLAWGLALRGIAVLRYEKRSKVHAARMAGAGTLTVREETIDDALAGLALLRSLPEVDPDRIFVLGHSLGGTLLPRIGERDSTITGLVFLAAAVRPLEDMILEQIRYIHSLDSTPAEEKKGLPAIEAEVARIKALDPATSDPAAPILGVPASYWLDLRGYRPHETARLLRQPMLILQGGRDYQVTLEDFELWKAALGDRPDVSLLSFPELNHLFMPGTGKATPSEYNEPGHLSPVVVEHIASWILRTSAGGR